MVAALADSMESNRTEFNKFKMFNRLNDQSRASCQLKTEKRQLNWIELWRHLDKNRIEIIIYNLFKCVQTDNLLDSH